MFWVKSPHLTDHRLCRRVRTPPPSHRCCAGKEVQKWHLDPQGVKQVDGYSSQFLAGLPCWRCCFLAGLSTQYMEGGLCVRGGKSAAGMVDA